MDHRAPADYPIEGLLAHRWSPVAFTERALTQAEIHSLLEAARWAPSSFNEQPWRMIYATKEDGEKRIKLESLLTEGNAWAKAAPFLALFIAKKTFTRNGKPNRHHAHDCGSAMTSLFLQATAMGMQGHGMAGFDTEKAQEIYGMSDDYLPLTMIAVGYHDGATTDPKLQEREASPRIRKTQGEWAMRGEWHA